MTRAKAPARKKTPSADPTAGFDPVVDLYARGDLRLALDVADFLTRSDAISDEGLLLAARAAVRLGDDAQALRFTARLRASGHPDWQVLEGYVRGRGGDAAGGRRLLRESLASRNAAERAEAAHRIALLDWTDRKTEEAEAVILRELPTARGAARVELQQMLGTIEITRERFAIAGRHFDQALRFYRADGVHDDWLRCALVAAVSSIALETLDFGLVSEEVTVDADTGRDARPAAALAASHLGWLRMLDGRDPDGLELFQRGRSLAPNDASISSAEVDLAAYSRIRGDRNSARDHLELARHHLGKQRWSDADADERATLLGYVLETYQLEPTSAGGPLMRYLSNDVRKRAAMGPETDGRMTAHELTARGVLDAIHGRRASARSILSEAREDWSRIGYRFREILVLLLLHDLSGRPEDLDAARRAVEVAPRSWLYREVDRRRETETGPESLTPAERRVMQAICQGKTSKQIAAEFGRSFHTIRNQTLAVYQTMGVRTRAALVAECARLGLLRDQT